MAYPFNDPDLIQRTEAGIHILSYFPPINERLNISGNRFDNLNYGIRIAGTERTDIDHNQFDNCSVGISILNYTYTSQYMIQDINITHNELNNCNINMQLSRTQARIVQNTINSTYIPPSGGLTDANNIGIFIQGSNAQVLSNTINFVQAGVVLLSNDTDPMLVSNNSFNANIVGVFAYGNNRHVQVVCNDFNIYAVAMYALNYTSSFFLYPNENGILSDQGNCNPIAPQPADNFFGQFLGTLGWHIVATPYPVPNNFIYWYRNAPGFVPTVTVGEVTPVECIPPFVPLPPRDILCGIIGSEMIMEDEEIRNLSDEGIKNYEAMKKVYYYVYDQNDTLAAEGLLEDLDTYFGDRLLLNHYLIKGNFEAANNILVNLPDAREEEQRFIQLYQIYTKWRLSDRDLFQITTAEEDTIRQIAATTTQTATEARTLLYLLRGEEYPIDLPPIADLIDSSLFQNVLINFKGGAAANAIGQTKVGNPYPNPVSNQISIDYRLPEQEKASISFFNVQGVEISTQHISGNGTLQFATDKWSKGMYFYRVMLPNNEIIYGKIVIIK
ncbi:MAG: T9SS type A sorting domain-containing protein [Sphingobacteriales bacterium]|nr:MAG: T9SS type A sorting domain-containing protein [Sphingobacteriales bacterium]